MTFRILFLSIYSILIFGCNSGNIESEKDSNSNDISTENFKWETHKNAFKYAKLISIDFNKNGKPIQSTDNLKKVDDKFKIQNFKHFSDTSWISSTEIFHYGTIEFNNVEQPVFLSIRDFDGLSYNYHLISFNLKGEIVKSWIIAYSWGAAECIGYDRVYIESDSMISETLEKCYDEELEGVQRVDSIRDIVSLTDFKFIQ